MVRGNLEYQKNDYEIVDYVINKFKGLFRFRVSFIAFARGLTARPDGLPFTFRMLGCGDLLRFKGLFGMGKRNQNPPIGQETPANVLTGELFSGVFHYR